MGSKVGKEDSVEKYREEPDEVAMKLTGRKCTDVLFLILLIAFWVGMFIVAAVGFLNGDPAKLLMATDYAGNSCGSLVDTCVSAAGDCGSFAVSRGSGDSGSRGCVAVRKRGRAARGDRSSLHGQPRGDRLQV